MQGWEWSDSGGSLAGGAAPLAASNTHASHDDNKMLAVSTVRDMADSWSLAGDRKLLQLLENIHQSLMDKCERANVRLDEMTHALDTASVALQNVNNRFTALGNTQFVESRVYDDDVTATPSSADTSQQDTKKKDAVQAAAEELPAVSATLGQYYDEVHIAPDTDSDSDSGQEDSVVLRPKDLYTERPLPHIIGTAAWHNKWHAGLVQEDSDSDSSVDKREREEDQYSSAGSLGQYEPSDATYYPTTVDKMPDTYSADTVMSEDSTSHVADVPPTVAIPPVKPSPSDFAAELARRLGGDVVPPQRSSDQPPQRAGKKVTTYLDRGPQPRVTGNIFLDEPPPIDQTVEESEPEDENYDDDIFADLHNTNIFSRNTKNSNLFNKASSSYGGLFDGLIPEDNKNERDIFDDFADDNKNVVNRKVMKNDDRLFDDDDDDLFADVSVVKTANKPIIPTSAPNTGGLFDNEEGEDLFADNVQPKDAQITANKEVKHAQTKSVTSESTIGSKKPIGGKSLFGSNQEAERIGAAILKHHQRKASVSSDDNDESYDDSSKVETKSSRTEDKSNMDSTDDDFDDLFAVKSKKSANPNAKFDDLFAKSIERNKSLEGTDLFDESAKSPADVNKSGNLRSCTDDNSDMDDLFITTAKSSLESAKNLDRKSDDTKSKPVLNDNILNYEAKALQIENKTQDLKTQKISIFTDDLFDNTTKSSTSQSINEKKTEKSIFADDLFDDGDIFTSTMIAKAENPVKKDAMRALFGDEHDLFAEIKTTKQQEPKNNVKTKSIFDDDSEDDLFAKPNLTVPNEKIIVETVMKNNDTQIETDKKSDALDEESNGTNENITKTSTTKSRHTNNLIKETAQKQITDVSNKPQINEKPNTLKQVNSNELERENAIEDLSSKLVVEKSPSVAEKPILKNKPRIINTKEKHDIQKKHNSIETNEKITADKTQSVASQKSVLDNMSTTLKKETIDEPKIEGTGETISKEIKEKTHEIKKRVAKEEITISPSCNDMPNIQDSVEKTPKIQIEVPELEVADVLSELPISVPDIPETSKTVKENCESVMKSENLGDDFFNTIFDDQPPVFQRSTEPKKSKNINALFDDDSDDEGLFLKKHDTLSITNSDDAKSIDDFIPPSEDRLFGIFHNDPPDLDVDFAFNNNENKDDFIKIGSTEITLETEDLPAISKVEVNIATNKEELSAKGITSDDAFEDLEYVKIIRNEDGQKRKEILSPSKTTPPKFAEIKSLERGDLNFERPISANRLDSSILSSEKEIEHTVDKTTDMQRSNECSKLMNENQNYIKPIGKLKPINLNINVQGLIPGAVPKKLTRSDSKEQSDHMDNKIDKTERLVTTTTNVIKFDSSQETLPIKVDALDGAVGSMVKSVSFDKSPESPTLVNTYSKERVKIQVKRRPSTRQARKDAIRKSAHNLNFESDLPIDVTDNFTVSLPTSPRDVSKSLECNLSIHNLGHMDTKIHVNKLQDANVDELFSNSEVDQKHKESETVETKNPKLKKLEDETFKTDTQIPQFYTNVQQETVNVDTRIPDVEKKVQKEAKPSQFDTDSSSSEGTSINTLGKVYAAKNTTEKLPGQILSAKQDIFGADDDDILSFNTDDVKGKKEDLLKSTVLTDTIDDLFTTKTSKEAENYKPIKPVEKSKAKNLIFDADESDIDELFNPNVIHSKTGAIRKTITTTPITTPSNRDTLETSKSNEVTMKTVHEPPKTKSSLFEDDLDDVVLFGGATKPIQTLRETKIANIHEKLSEEDLFLTKKKEDLRKQPVEKKSLFGDDSDDDIFATKRSFKASTAPPSTQQREKEQSSQHLTSAEEVFHDPLSHFD